MRLMTYKKKVELWEKVMGQWVDSGGIENLFEEGRRCDELWKEAFENMEKILDQLGVEECKELENIYSCMNEICKLVSIRMFDYGTEYAEIRIKTDPAQ